MRKLGINGMERIGKLSIWHHVQRKYFSEIVVNICRETIMPLNKIADFLKNDSVYGSTKKDFNINEVDVKSQSMLIDGTRVYFLNSHTNPSEINWQNHGVELIVDTTGLFLDPTLLDDSPGGSLRGHIISGAKKVILSTPFKLKDRAAEMILKPENEWVTTIMGINDNDYNPIYHKFISTASCTSTSIAHMMKPLINIFGPKKILSASVTTVHPQTESRNLFGDRLQPTARDEAEYENIKESFIVTESDIAPILRLVIPEIRQIGLIAESVKIPAMNMRKALNILVLNLQEESLEKSVRKESVNKIYHEAAALDTNGYLKIVEKQDSLDDIDETEKAAAVILGHATHRRTGEVYIDSNKFAEHSHSVTTPFRNNNLQVLVTQIVIYGWYDNTMDSYIKILGDRTVSIAEDL